MKLVTDMSPGVIGQHTVRALKQMADELDQGALLTIELNKMRLRLLSFQGRS